MDYINGSDVLVVVGNKAIAHCTSHTLTWEAETKERSVKPKLSDTTDDGTWKETSIVSKSAQLQVEGLQFYDEDEFGYADLLDAFDAGNAVQCKCHRRKAGASVNYATGNFVVTNITETAPAGDDATYSATLKNSGKVTINTAGLAVAAAAT